MEANALGDAAQAVAQPKKGKLKRHLCTVDEKWWLSQLTQQEPDLTFSAYTSKFNAQYLLPRTGCNMKALTNIRSCML